MFIVYTRKIQYNEVLNSVGFTQLKAAFNENHSTFYVTLCLYCIFQIASLPSEGRIEFLYALLTHRIYSNCEAVHFLSKN